MKTVASGRTLKLMGRSSQLFPIAIPRLSFQCVDAIGHLLDKPIDEFDQFGIGIVGQRGVDEGAIHGSA